ncbi:hypothetical protein BGZ83_011906 [Gryganskiella cystojenkinii]|nr:hypothetical protein BGZ83_011906 [Gryganskiella cystojenkinii]
MPVLPTATPSFPPSMTTTSTIPVLIAGGGPVGLYQALLLTKLGIKCRVIERETSVSPLSKALGMQPRCLEILAMTGSIEDFVQQSQKVTEMSMWWGTKKVATLPMAGSTESQYSHGLFLEQAKTSKIFIDQLQQVGVQVDYGWELLDTKVVQDPANGTSFVETTIRRALSGDNNAPGEAPAIGEVEERQEQEGKEYETEIIRSEYLVAADGGRSTVRHKLNIPFPGRTLDFKTLIWDGQIETDLLFSNINFIRGMNKKSMIYFPLSNGNVRLIVEDGVFAPGEDMAKAMDGVTVDYFQGLMNDMLGEGANFKIKTTNWLTCFKVNERRADHFIYQERVFLAGDAAHIHSPSGGQGLNTGLQDVHNLAWKLALVLNKIASPALLETYPLEREPQADRAIKMSSFLFHQSRAQGLAADIKRYLMVFLAPFLSLAKKLPFFQQEVAMLKIRYEENSLNRAHATEAQPTIEYQRVGGRAGDGPLFELSSVHDETSSLYVHHLIKGVGRFHVLVFTSDQLALSTSAAQTAKQLSQNIDQHLSKWRSRWCYTSTLYDGVKGQDLFKSNIITGSVSSSSDDLDDLARNDIGDGKVYVDKTKIVHERYGCAWSHGQGGIVIVRPDSHIGYRVEGFGDQAWRDVDEYLGSILLETA